MKSLMIYSILTLGMYALVYHAIMDAHFVEKLHETLATAVSR